MPANILSDVDSVAGLVERALRTALVVNGDPLAARSLELILSAEAFKVEIAACGAEGLRMAQERPYDVIILDANLPDISGPEATRQLRLAHVKATVAFSSTTPATADSASTLHLSERH